MNRNYLILACLLIAGGCLKSTPIGEYADPPITKSLQSVLAQEQSPEAIMLSFDLPNPELLNNENINSIQSSVDLDSPPQNAFLLADFDLDGCRGNEIEFPVGSWKSSNGHSNLNAVVSLESLNRYGFKGNSLKVSYALEEGAQACAGAWLRLGFKPADAVDISSYTSFTFMLRAAEGREACSSKLIVELRSKNEVSSVMLSDIGTKWQQYRIPLTKFTYIADWKKITEILFFADSNSATALTGTFYLDDISVEK